MYKFTNISIEDGLSYSAINSIVQDNKGIIWFGTQNGLDRFDSINFENFKHDPLNEKSIPGNGIADLLVDGNKIWISTNAGFCSYNYITEELVRYENISSTSSLKKSNYTRAITQDNEDNNILWLGSYNGLIKFNKETKKFNRYFIKDDNKVLKGNITSIYDDANGDLWIGSYDGGLYKFDKESNDFWLVPNTKNMMILTIEELSHYGLLVGTENRGLYKLDIDNRRLKDFEDINNHEVNSLSIRCIIEDSKNNLWLGTQNKGLFIFEDYSKSIINLQHDKYDFRGLSNNYIRTLYIDKDGIVWIGTLSGGVCFFDPEKFRFQHKQSLPNKEDSILSNIVRGFVEDQQGNIWVATEGGGITKYQKETGDFKHYVHKVDDENTINSDLIRGVYKDNNGKVWVFTFSGICFYNKNTDNFIRYKLPDFINLEIDNKSLRFIFNDSNNNIWIGSEFGLIFINPIEKTFEHYHMGANNEKRITSNMTRFIFEEYSGKILLVTLDGNSIIDRDNNKVQSFNRTKSGAKSPYECFIFSMYEDNKYIWLGTFEGLYRNNKLTGKTIKYDENDGLANKVIYGILPDNQNRIWLSTNNGISFFNVKDEIFVNFDESDGLQSTEFNNSAYMKAKDGEMFFGGINGYNHFYPKNIKKDTSKVDLVFTNFTVSNEELDKPYYITEEGLLHIPYYANYFEFEFVAIEYSHPKKIQYRCKLEGFDEDWHDLKTNRRKSYRNVPSGEYIFKVKSTNRDKVWVENTISITIRVEQPPWQQSLNPVSGILKSNEVLEQYLKEMQRSNKELQQLNQNLINYNKELSKSVYKDALTGLFNRAGYMKHLEMYIENSNFPLGLFIIDIDNLKLINDNLGHEQGDKVLISFSNILSNYDFSDKSIVARIGGDEFAILVPNCDFKIMEDIQRWLSEIRKNHYSIDSDEFFCISFGYSTTFETEVDKLFSKADGNMYNYKRDNGLIARKRTLDYIQRQRSGLQH